MQQALGCSHRTRRTLVVLHHGSVTAFEETLMSELSQADRDALPAKAFGLPKKRAYPMPDANHARDATARASHEHKAGHITAAEKAQIDRKADRILGRSK